jgi:hypothetical protein
MNFPLSCFIPGFRFFKVTVVVQVLLQFQLASTNLWTPEICNVEIPWILELQLPGVIHYICWKKEFPPRSNPMIHGRIGSSESWRHLLRIQWSCHKFVYFTINVLWKLQKKTAPKCKVCKGRGFTECRLCRGESTIDWSPLFDPVVMKPCVCPTCDGNKYFLSPLSPQNTVSFPNCQIWRLLLPETVCVHTGHFVMHPQFLLQWFLVLVSRNFAERSHIALMGFKGSEEMVCSSVKHNTTRLLTSLQ